MCLASQPESRSTVVLKSIIAYSIMQIYLLIICICDVEPTMLEAVSKAEFPRTQLHINRKWTTFNSIPFPRIKTAFPSKSLGSSDTLSYPFMNTFI